jgi:hypothetical protein
LIHRIAGSFTARCLIAAAAEESAREYSGTSSRSWPMTAPRNQAATPSGRDGTSRAAA